MATTIGAKWVYACSLGTSSLATLALTLMYLMSSTHFTLILILRFIIGLAHGVLFPATVSLWSVWAVPQERSTLASIGFCGTHLGTSITMLIGGLLCRHLASGWLYLFFISSILGFTWFILWVSITANTPDQHPRISDQEKMYINRFTGNKGGKRAVSLSSIPWKKVIRCKPLNALIVTHIANLFGLFFFLTNLGKIVNQLFLLPPQLTGYILSFGFFLTWLSSLFSGKSTELRRTISVRIFLRLGIITDRLIRAKVLTLTTSRKIFNSLTSFIPALCMVSFCFCDSNNQVQGVITVLIFLASSG